MFELENKAFSIMKQFLPRNSKAILFYRRWKATTMYATGADWLCSTSQRSFGKRQRLRQSRERPVVGTAVGAKLRRTRKKRKLIGMEEASVLDSEVPELPLPGQSPRRSKIASGDLLGSGGRRRRKRFARKRHLREWWWYYCWKWSYHVKRKG